MEPRSRVLILLSLAVIASGCLHSGGSGTVTEGPESVTVESLSVQPSQIYEEQAVRASITAYNSGNLPADVLVGDKGRSILKDHCSDILENSEEGFSSSTSTTTENKDSYRLEPGQKLNVRWLLEQQGSVPIYGKRCDLDFDISFNYSVESYSQVQVKQGREVEGSPNLASESSTGPMVLAIEPLPGSTGKSSTYIATEDGDRYISILVELINKNPDEEFRKGLVDVDEDSMFIRASEPLQLDEKFVRNNGELAWVSEGYSDTHCDVPERRISLSRGRSVTMRCQVPLPESVDAPSVLSEVVAGVDYTYVKDAGERTVRVESRG